MSYPEYTILDEIETPSGVYRSVTISDAREQLEATEAQINAALLKQFPPIPESELRSALKNELDRLAGEMRERVVSQGAFIEEEYRLAYEEAIVWVEAGYPSVSVPDSVKVWATAAGMTSRAAADNLVATRAAFETVVLSIRRIRLLGKSAIDSALPQDIQSTADEYFQQMAQVLG